MVVGFVGVDVFSGVDCVEVYVELFFVVSEGFLVDV